MSGNRYVQDGGLRYVACETQCDLFVKSRERGYDSLVFIDAFMESECAADMDRFTDVNNWMGANYAMEVFEDEAGARLARGGELLGPAALEWIGYVYRYWAAKRGKRSREIHAIADARAMCDAYVCYNTLTSLDEVVDAIIESAEVGAEYRERGCPEAAFV